MSTSPYWIDFTDSQTNSPFVIKVNCKSHDVSKSPQGHFKYKIAIIILKNSKKIKNVRKKRMPWTRMNTNPLWINNALCTFFSVTCVMQLLSAKRAHTFTSKLKSTRELQSETTRGISRICPQMTLREILGKSQSKLDCLIFELFLSYWNWNQH